MDHAQNAARDIYSFGQARWIVGHDDHVGRFHGDIRADAAHRHADVGGGQRRRVVDAVAQHEDLAAFALKPLNRRDFVRRQQIGQRFLDAGLARHSLGGAGIVAGQHRHALDSGFAQSGDGAAGLGADGVLGGDRADRSAALRHDNHSQSLAIEGFQNGGRAGRKFDLLAFEPFSAARQDAFASDARLDSKAGMRHEILGGIVRFERKISRSRLFDDQLPQQMLGSLFGRRRNSQKVVLMHARAGSAARFRRLAKRRDMYDSRLAERQRAGFIEHDAIGLADGLQPGAALDQDAAHRQPPQSGGDRRWGGQHQSARAGDNQHRNAANNRGLERHAHLAGD
ncbi:MAG: hypothetical protein BWZ10_02146 [candidate division BRC1 bacterium ADurb.BinA364]|nr:MAG: hypothetical protein BWZ10_02146 [candidate division BRC1 bacterium ADurb.BinA364]